MTKDQGARDDRLFELQQQLLKQIAAGELSPVEADAALRDFMRGAKTAALKKRADRQGSPGPKVRFPAA
jgi:hypothetical protein